MTVLAIGGLDFTYVWPGERFPSRASGAYAQHPIWAGIYGLVPEFLLS